MKNKLLKLGALCVCLLVLAAGCGKEQQQAVPDTEPAVNTQPEEAVPEPEPTEEPENHDGEARSLYTGEWIKEELVFQRPIAVMTENTKVTLPQYGLGNADIIYECPVEGGITRLMAIYQDYSGMEKVGNVRSCRLYYVYFAKEFDAVYFHAGESKYALDVLNSSFIDNVDGITGKGGAYYFRDKSRKAPHNLYTSSDKLTEALAGYGYSTVLAGDTASYYRFTTEDAPNLLAYGEDAAVVSMYYVDPKPWFEYHPEDGRYYRHEFGAAQVDGLTGEQLSVTNIIIQNCNSSLKDSSNGTLDIDYKSGGTGKYITMGKAIDITWTRESASSRTRYFDAAGEEIVLNPGRTWVEIVENGRADKNIIYGSKEELR